MIDLALVKNVVTIFGVIAGFSYYIMTVRNAGRARRTQLLVQLRQPLMDLEFQKATIDLLSMDFSSYEEFLEKFYSKVNPENYALRFRQRHYYDGIGYLLHENLIDLDSVYNLIGGPTLITVWRKWKPIIKGNRERFDNPDWFKWFEYLADEFVKLRKRKGLPEYMADPAGWVKS